MADGYGHRRLHTSGGTVNRAIQGYGYQAAALRGGRRYRQQPAPP